MDPLTNLQVAIKNNVDVFYFSCKIPHNVLFVESGAMGKRQPSGVHVAVQNVSIPVLLGWQNFRKGRRT